MIIFNKGTYSNHIVPHDVRICMTDTDVIVGGAARDMALGAKEISGDIDVYSFVDIEETPKNWECPSDELFDRLYMPTEATKTVVLDHLIDTSPCLEREGYSYVYRNGNYRIDHKIIYDIEGIVNLSWIFNQFYLSISQVVYHNRIGLCCSEAFHETLITKVVTADDNIPNWSQSYPDRDNTHYLNKMKERYPDFSFPEPETHKAENNFEARSHLGAGGS